MADTSSELVSLIKSDPTMASLVGSRIYPMALPTGTSYEPGSPDLPAIHYGLVSDPTSDEIPLSIEQYQFTVTANEYKEMRQVVDALRRTLHRYKGGIFKYIQYINSTEEWDGDTRVYYNPVTIQCKVFDQGRM